MEANIWRRPPAPPKKSKNKYLDLKLHTQLFFLIFFISFAVFDKQNYQKSGLPCILIKLQFSMPTVLKLQTGKARFLTYRTPSRSCTSGPSRCRWRASRSRTARCTSLYTGLYGVVTVFFKSISTMLFTFWTLFYLRPRRWGQQHPGPPQEPPSRRTRPGPALNTNMMKESESYTTKEKGFIQKRS